MDAVVPDVSRGHHEHLPLVAGVGENLLITVHTGVEGHLAGGGSDSPDGIAFKSGAVLEHEDRGTDLL